MGKTGLDRIRHFHRKTQQQGVTRHGDTPLQKKGNLVRHLGVPQLVPLTHLRLLD